MSGNKNVYFIKIYVFKELELEFDYEKYY